MVRRGCSCRVALCLLLLSAAPGCSSDFSYALGALAGQINLVARARPVEQVLAGNSLTAEQRESLELILDIRRFAVEDLGLNAGRNYTTFVDTGGQPVAWNLSAAAKDSLTPYVWTFPLLGSIPYIGFFSRDEARAYQDRLVAEGWDTVLYPIDSYSTLGTFPDPITSGMLDRAPAEQADLVIHELTHVTVWSEADRDFNENVATFVARVGALRYLALRYGEDSDIDRLARDGYHDADIHNAFLAGLRREVEDYYASNLSSEEKIAGREALFEAARQRFRDEVLPSMIRPQNYEWVLGLKFNNAWLLLNARYNRSLADFEAVYEAVGRDFAQALRVFKDAAASEAPIAYLQQFAASR